MYALLIYSLKAAACLAAFYLFFKLLLSRETFHRFNRVLLLALLVLSFVLPVCVVTVYREAPAVPELPFAAIAPAPTTATVAPASAPFPWKTFLGGLFLAGAVASLAATLVSLGCVVRLIRRGRRERLDDGTVLVRLAQPVTPFSWGRYIVVSERDLAESAEQILLHERAHVRLRHSWDLLVTDLAASLQWFNPAMWLLRRELRAIHEYEADEAVLDSGTDATQYQLLLIKKAAGGRWYSIANSFNHSKLKNRITMMLRKRSRRGAFAKALFAVPLTGLALASFARTAYVVPTHEGTKSESNLQADPSSVSMKTDSVLYVMETASGKENRIEVRKADSVMYIIQTAPRKENRIEVRKADSVMYIIQTAPRKESRIEMRMRPADDARPSMQSTVVVTSAEKPDGEQPNGRIVRIESGGDSARVFVVEGSDATDAMQRNIILVDGRETTPEELRALDPARLADIRFVSPLPEAYKGRDADGVIEIATRDNPVQPTDSDSVKMDEIAVVAFGSGNKDLTALIQKGRTRDGGPGPIILIDGREVESGMLAEADPARFESITVLKSLPEAFKGRDADGVVLITTKGASQGKVTKTDSPTAIRGVGIDTLPFSGPPARARIQSSKSSEGSVSGRAIWVDTLVFSGPPAGLRVRKSKSSRAVAVELAGTPARLSMRNSESVEGSDTPVPLYVIDGREATPDELDALPADNRNISIEIFKDSEHTEPYAKKFGEKARNGVVVITTEGKRQPADE